VNASVISLAEEMSTCTPAKPVVAKTKTRRVFEEDMTALRDKLTELRAQRNAVSAKRDSIRQAMQAKLDAAQKDVDAIDGNIADVQLSIARKMQDEEVFLRRTKGREWRKPFFLGLAVFPVAALIAKLLF